VNFVVSPDHAFINSCAKGGTAADAAHAELAKFAVRSPGVVDKRMDMVLNFDAYQRLPTCRRR
jgi:hypothetical protein